MATNMVNARTKHAGLKKIPRMMHKEPTDSASAARNPQNAGAKSIPRPAMFDPIASQVPGPPVIFPYPWKINMLNPTPRRRMNSPK